MNENRTVALVLARGGSKSIPLKNIKPIAGKPLISWTLEAAASCNFIDSVYVATDCELIKKCIETAQLQKVFVIPRSAASATDSASSEIALLDFCAAHIFKNLFFIQATSPLLQTTDLEAAWDLYQSKDFDSILSVVRQKRFIWQETAAHAASPINYDYRARPRRQDFGGFLVENGAFYLSSRENILASACRLSGRIGFVEMGEESYFELDEPADWPLIESLLKQHKCEG